MEDWKRQEGDTKVSQQEAAIIPRAGETKGVVGNYYNLETQRRDLPELGPRSFL